MISLMNIRFISRSSKNLKQILKSCPRCSSSSSNDSGKKILRNPTKEELQWRIPWHKKTNEFYSKFKLFAPEKSDNAKVIQFLQSDFDFRPSAIRNWFRKKRQEMEEDTQKFSEDRLKALGSELAASHFIVHRGGSVKFIGDPIIYTRNKDGEYDLPTQYNPKYIVEEISCDNLPLTYDGLENFKGLQKIKSFSVKGCLAMDDWCIDRISGQFHESLEVLDIRNCPNVSPRGLEALYRITNLRLLHVDKLDSKTFEMVCLLLEELFPKLKIKHD